MPFIQLNSENRIVGLSYEENESFPIFVENDVPDDMIDYLYINKEFIYNPCQMTIDKIKNDELIQGRNENIDSIPDIQDALIEVANMANDNEVSMSDVQDALIELANIVSELTE